VPPVLRGGLPVAFDPGLDELSGAGVDGDAPQELWAAALGTEGWVFARSSDHVIGVGPGLGERWQGLNGTLPGALAVGGHGTLAVTERDRGVKVLAADTGEVVFELGFVDRAAYAPDGALVVSSSPFIDPGIVCVERDGSTRWEHRCRSSAFAVDDDAVVVTSTTGGVIAYDLASGETRWQQPELRTAGAVALDVRGYAYVLGPGWFAGIRRDGSLQFRLPIPTRGSMTGVALGRDRTAYVTVGEELVAIR
jgi:outer membrane protein assembly factor BamB